MVNKEFALLQSLLGELFIRALDTIDTHIIKLYRSKSSGREIYEVTGK